jgi:hypothetical protein
MDIVGNKDLIETLSYLTIIISTLTGAILYLLKQYKKYQKYLDSVFTGHWVNEGRIDIINENTHSVDLSIESKDRSIIGEAGFFKFDNRSEIRSIGVSGKRRFKRCRLEFKHYRQGNVTIYACVKIVLKKDQLIWKLKKGTADFFPEKTILWLS